ncbi:hypothetical protein FNV43_RR21180 [Rhamnella rubrinervis]|uniref:Pectate lyase n=1 Tax=Rhamnella rubrinervis TaxID=2594499 RepID=A0A8K0GV73_9ROSA|nr:hypothetical protein FNV43_RR21180 [Rhamnella rubrinervis]
MVKSVDTLLLGSSARASEFESEWRHGIFKTEGASPIKTKSYNESNSQFVTVVLVAPNPINPKPGTLRYGVSMLKGKVWITFQRDMTITLQKPFLISSFTAIDGRGAVVHIAGNACLVIFKVNNMIKKSKKNRYTEVYALGQHIDMSAHKEAPLTSLHMQRILDVWIDHNTLFACHDGRLDVTRGSTGVTISNNWFREQDKVMLLGDDDGYLRDKNMKVTVMYSHFEPNCNQRMPRIRHGYAHVAYNLYLGWSQYATGSLGGSTPVIASRGGFTPEEMFLKIELLSFRQASGEQSHTI